MKTTKKKLTVVLVLCMCLLLSLAGCGETPKTTSQDAPATTRTVVDSFGREVKLPAEIKSVALTSSFPVYLSFVSAFGEQSKVCNGLPAGFAPETYKFDFVFAPQVKEAPTVMSNASGDVNAEQLMALKPDVCFVNSEDMAKVLADKGLTVVGIKLTDFNSFRDIYRIMGEVFDKKDVAAQYLNYLDDTLKLVQDRVAAIPQDKRTRVLYFDKARMLRPNTVSEWWIPAAGGVSCTADQATLSQVGMDMEAVWKANPDVIIEMLAANVPAIYADPLWADVKAVKNKQVFNTPVGCHLMGNWTSEQPLLILWAAQKFYPDGFADINLVERFGDFYRTFYHVDLTEEQIKDIIDG